VTDADMARYTTDPAILTLQFTNRTNVVRPRWEKGVEFTHSPELFNSLYSFYQNVWSMLKTKDVESLIRTYRDKSADMAYTYNQTLGEYEDQLRRVFSERLSQPGNIAWPLKRESLSLKLFADNKLAALESSDNCSPLLLFNESEMLCSYFDAIVYQPTAESSFVIIR
jgi:hypothetical protein